MRWSAEFVLSAVSAAQFPRAERAGDRVPGAVERGQVEPAECAGGREGGEGFVDAGAHAGDQFFRVSDERRSGEDDLCGPARIRLREDFEVDFGGVAGVH